MADTFETSLSTHDDESITVRDRDLATEIMGELDFASATYLLFTGEEPTAGERDIVDACLSALMVHGMTPHAVATRMTLLSAPESMQAAIASGLLGVGGRFVGAMENCSTVLQEITDSDDVDRAVEETVAAFVEGRDIFPGLGHPHFSPTDPRSERLFAMAEDHGIAGEHVAALHAVRDEFEAVLGKHLTINVTGAIGAVTADMGLPPAAARGLAAISRTTGLVAEVLDEQESPVARDLYHHIEERVEYAPKSE